MIVGDVRCPLLVVNAFQDATLQSFKGKHFDSDFVSCDCAFQGSTITATLTRLWARCCRLHRRQRRLRISRQVAQYGGRLRGIVVTELREGVERKMEEVLCLAWFNHSLRNREHCLHLSLPGMSFDLRSSALAVHLTSWKAMNGSLFSGKLLSQSSLLISINCW